MTIIDKGYEIIQGLVGSRWVPEILYAIDSGYIRYSEIENNIPNISHSEMQRKL